jgi:hypothetical protein
MAPHATTTRRRRRPAARKAAPVIPPRPPLTRAAAAILSWSLAQVLVSGAYLGTCLYQTGGQWGRCNVPWLLFLGTIYSGGQGTMALMTEAFRGGGATGALLQTVISTIEAQQGAGGGGKAPAAATVTTPTRRRVGLAESEDGKA